LSLVLLENSKKIKKIRRKDSLSPKHKDLFGNSNGKQYEKIEPKIKKKIILDLKKEAIKSFKLNQSPEEISPRKVRELLDEIDYPLYNKLLEEVLSKNVFFIFNSS